MIKKSTHVLQRVYIKMNSNSKINKSGEGMKHVYYSNAENDAKVLK